MHEVEALGAADVARALVLAAYPDAGVAAGSAWGAVEAAVEEATYGSAAVFAAVEVAVVIQNDALSEFLGVVEGGNLAVQKIVSGPRRIVAFEQREVALVHTDTAGVVEP